MNILLSGPPFSGKTTITKKVSELLEWTCLDLDALLVERYQMTCTEQFQTFGEEHFRRNEQTVLEELERGKCPQVISLGGGALTFVPNAEVVKQLGFLVCLECSMDVLQKRLENSRRSPAYLESGISLENLCKNRRECYLQCGDFFLDVTTNTPLQSALLIVEEYKKRYGE